MSILRKQRIHALLWTLVFVLSAQTVAAKYSDSCRSVIFSDSTKVKRLYGKRVHDRVIPASTTKVMTALLVMEHLSLDSYVTVSRNATLPQPSKIYVKEGEQYKVRDLLYAMLLKSANDASVVLAEAVAGSHWKFVQMMNAKAKAIGAKHTRFSNAHGLPSKEKQYTTAYDMYLIFRQALRYPFFGQAIKLKYKTIQSRAGREIALKSHNKILFNDWDRKIYGKTGYTHAAGACFVGTLQKGNSTLIIAVFNCKDRWSDIRNIVSSYGGVRL
jgi:D-alanyl-D-alanine carboxypeptidase (penicillin-binding protein 5/6)